VALTLRKTVDVVVAALTGAGITVHRGVGPADPLAAAPYVVVRAGAVQTDGPASALHDDTLPEVWMHCVGKTSEQVEWIADKAFDSLLNTATPLTPPTGRAWMNPGHPVRHVLTRPVERDDDFGTKAPLFYAVHIVQLPSTPA
jgi:hypothetical protein